MTVFNSLANLKNGVLVLDKAEERNVLTQKVGEDASKTDRYKAIWNIQKNHLSTIASRKYKIVQHEQVFNSVIDALLDLGISCEGRLKEFHNGDVASMELIFKDKEYRVKDDSKEGVTLGIRVTNGFNLWNSVQMQLFGFRVVCENGMWLGKAIGQVGCKRNHIGSIDLPQMAREFIKRVVDNNRKLQILIDESLADSFEWRLAEQLLNTMIKTTKYREILLAELQKLGKDRLTRYDLYNLLTRLASDSKMSLRESAEAYLQDTAQKFLVTDMKVLEARYIKKERKE